MTRSARSSFLLAIPLAITASFTPAPAQPGALDLPCRTTDYHALGRNPDRAELRCRFGVSGPGRFGLLSYVDVPVYQPATPMPGTHLVGVAGQPRPRPYETYEEWEWRVLRSEFGPEVTRIHRDLDLLDPMVASRIMWFERRLAEEGIRATRRETWRSPQRQAFLFQQGRSRPGPLATTTLTSWHSQLDEFGFPAGRAVDYDVPRSRLGRFHELATEVGLESFGPDSHDPGHVFLPLAEPIPQAEIALLRILPRVPEVTLATGLPVDRPLPYGGREQLRGEVVRFASQPFLPLPEARIVAPPPEQILLLRGVTVTAPVRLAAVQATAASSTCRRWCAR